MAKEIIATLVREKGYTLLDKETGAAISFERGVPKKVTAAQANRLAEVHREFSVGGEKETRYHFKIEQKEAVEPQLNRVQGGDDDGEEYYQDQVDNARLPTDNPLPAGLKSPAERAAESEAGGKPRPVAPAPAGNRRPAAPAAPKPAVIAPSA